MNLTDQEKQEIVAWIRSEHEAGRALNIHAVRRRRPDLLKRVYETRPFWGWWKAIEDAGLDYGDLKVQLQETVTCRICGCEGRQLNSHLTNKHGITKLEYLERFPDAEIASELRRSEMMRKGGRFLLPPWEPLYSDEYMMDRAFRYHRMGHAIRTTWILENDHNLWQHVHRQGTTWEEFITSLGIEYPEVHIERKPSITREELLDGLREFVREEGEVPSLNTISKKRHLLLTGIRRYFDHYDDALKAAGLPLPHRPFAAKTDMSPEEAMEELRDLVAKGARVTAAGIAKGLGRADLHSVITRMGGYPEVRKRLGIEKPPPRRKEVAYSREETVAALRRRAKEGKPLLMVTVRRGPDADPALFDSAKRHFAKWDDLLGEAGLVAEHHAKDRARRRRADLLEELRHLHAEGHGLDVLSVSTSERSAKLFDKCSRFFGGWREALEAAGLGEAQAAWHESFVAEVREELEAWKREGRGLSAREVKSSEEGLALHRRARAAFGSWGRALKAVGVSTATGRRRNPEKEALRREVVEELGVLVRENRLVTPGAMRETEEGADLYRRGRKAFGTWRKALRASGLKPRGQETDDEGEGTKRRRRRSSPRRYGGGRGKMADERRAQERQEVIEAIRELDRENRPLFLRAIRRDEKVFAVYERARGVFRSWKYALKEAGCEPKPLPPLPKSKIVEELELAYPIDPKALLREAREERERAAQEERERVAREEAAARGEGGPVPMPVRGWRAQKKGEKVRNTPSKAEKRKKGKKGKRKK